MQGIFIGIPDDSSGWIFYVPSTKKIYMDATFDKRFTSRLVLSDLHFDGALKLRRFINVRESDNVETEATGTSVSLEEKYPSDSILPPPSRWD